MADEPPRAEGHASTKAKDQILRNTLRYTISAKEYETLQQFLAKRSPQFVKNHAPQVPDYAALVRSPDDYNVAAVRASLRVFAATATGWKLFEIVTTDLLERLKGKKKYALKSSCN